MDAISAVEDGDGEATALAALAAGVDVAAGVDAVETLYLGDTTNAALCPSNVKAGNMGFGEASATTTDTGAAAAAAAALSSTCDLSAWAIDDVGATPGRMCSSSVKVMCKGGARHTRDIHVWA